MAFNAKEFSPNRVAEHVREGVAALLHPTVSIQPEDRAEIEFLVNGGGQVFSSNPAERPARAGERRSTYQGMEMKEIPSVLRAKVEAAVAVAQIQRGFSVQLDRVENQADLGEVGKYLTKGGLSAVFVFDGPYFQKAVYNVNEGIFAMSIEGTGRTADLPEFERAAGFDRKLAKPIMSGELDISASSSLAGDFYTPVAQPKGPFYGLRPPPQPIVARAA